MIVEVHMEQGVFNDKGNLDFRRLLLYQEQYTTLNRNKMPINFITNNDRQYLLPQLRLMCQ